ncbi:helix-turn-helix domain-containing protein [Phytohabitans suffuscus]|uniref:Transcriptional regulator n=1 Tax=Phytohabitans suffuscus TaxID=624315 RepID=A0A6F8YGQ8_9ACTN|nr:helix-turn-helix transcriptional regulator [Phytohabitans suffuscus]BCB85131.1 transcriptional regulator [Phytohabitans suffuscus]
MPPAPSPMVRRRRLGAELRRLREVSGLTGDQVIARVGWASASKLSRLENGRSRPDLSDVLDLLDLYEVSGSTREELIGVTRDAGNTRGWLRSYPVMTQRQRSYAELEAGCADIFEYGPVIVPGLLQTPGYTRVRLLSSREVIAPEDAEDPETEIAARVARQSTLTRKADPPRYEAVLEEASLGARGGPPPVMAGQLRHLARLAELPNVTLWVLPSSAKVADWYLPETAFSIYRFADPDDPDAVAVEALAADLILTEDDMLARYGRVFDWLRQAARPPAESLTWIAEVAAALGPPTDEDTDAPPALLTPPVQRRRRTPQRSTQRSNPPPDR